MHGCLTPWDVQSKRIYAGGVAPTLPSGTNEGMNIQPIVMVEMDNQLQKGCLTPWDVQSKQIHNPHGGISPTLSAGGDNWNPMNIQPIIAEDKLDEYVIRRLTPRECERLQGFHDDWTLIPWKGKPAEECPDGPRYKCIGNSMATNVIRLIGERIEEVEALITSNEGNHDGHTT